MDRDPLGFIAANKFDRSFHLIAASEPIAGVVETFKKNMTRLDALHFTPPFLTFFAALFERMRCAGEVTVTGKVTLTGFGEESQAHDQAVIDAMGEETAKQRTAYLKTWKGKREEWATFSMTQGFGLLGQILVFTNVSAPNFLSMGISSIFSSMIIGAWTAFEALAEDLWVACVNGNLRLAFIALDAEPSQGDSDQDVERKHRVKFSLPLRFLQKPDFDIKAQMGTVLRSKWNFDRKDEAADAYLKIFREKGKELKEIFESNDLRWLSAVRNVLIHNGGVADEEFLKLVKNHDRLKDVTPGTEIPLDGALTAELVSAASVKGKALIDLIDDWIKNNPS
jgi:hypothetical protein